MKKPTDEQKNPATFAQHCRTIDLDAIKEKSAIALLHGVEKCKAPHGCESLQYKCSAQQCKYDGSKDCWQDNAEDRAMSWSYRMAQRTARIQQRLEREKEK